MSLRAHYFFKGVFVTALIISNTGLFGAAKVQERHGLRKVGKVDLTRLVQMHKDRLHDDAEAVRHRWTSLVKSGVDPFAPSDNGVNPFVSMMVPHFTPDAILANLQYNAIDPGQQPLLSYEDIKVGIKKTLSQLMNINGHEYEFDVIIRHLCTKPELGFTQEEVHAALNKLDYSTVDSNKVALLDAFLN